MPIKQADKQEACQKSTKMRLPGYRGATCEICATDCKNIIYQYPKGDDHHDTWIAEHVIVMIVTLLLTVLVDLITAVGVGIIIASFVSARWREEEELGRITRVNSPDSEASMTDEERALIAKANGHIMLTRLIGRFSYASSRELVTHTTPPDDSRTVIVWDFSRLDHLDVSAALAIDELLERREAAGLPVIIAGMDTDSEHILSRLHILDRIPLDRRFPDTVTAMRKALEMLKGL